MTYKEILNILKAKVRKDQGRRCKYFNISCFVCQQYLMLDLLQDDVDLEKYESL
jgi:hypothetical protein